MFNNSYAAPSLSDIAAVTRNDGFVNGNDWWILVVLFAIFNGGFGGYGGYGRTAEMQSGFNYSNIDSKLNQLGNGICSLGYDQLAQMNGINQNINNAAYAVQTAITGVGSQVAENRCQAREGISQVRYDLASGTAALTNAITQQTQAIMANDNTNYRQLHDEIMANKLEAKDTRIAELTAQVQALSLAASQQAQNAYLVNQIKPCAVPAYVVANPYCGTPYNYGCCNA